MAGRPERWCVVASPAAPLVSESLEAVSQEVARSAFLALPKRTLVVAPRGSIRDSRWSADVALVAPVAPCGSGPLMLLAAVRTSRASDSATVAVLFPSSVQDTIRYMGAVRDAAQWVDRHGGDIVVVGRSVLEDGGWPAGMDTRPAPVRPAELRARRIPWQPLALVFRDSTMLRLMEIHAPQWWQAVSQAPDLRASSLWGACSGLPAFDVLRDVLLHSLAHVRVRPFAPEVRAERGVGGRTTERDPGELPSAWIASRARRPPRVRDETGAHLGLRGSSWCADIVIGGEAVPAELFTGSSPGA